MSDSNNAAFSHPSQGESAPTHPSSPWTAPASSQQPAFSPPTAVPPPHSQGTPQPIPPQPAGFQNPSGPWMMAPRPGIIPLRPLSLGDLFEGTFRAVRANPVVMFGFALAIMMIAALMAGACSYFIFQSFTTPLFDDAAGATEEDYLTQMASQLASLAISGGLSFLTTVLATTVLIGFATLSVHDAVIGRKVDIGQAWKAVAPRLLPLIANSFIILFIQGALIALISAPFAYGFWLLIPELDGADSALTILLIFTLVLLLAATVFVISIAINTKFLYSPVVVVLEHQGPLSAITRSWKLTNGAFWRTLGRLLLMTIAISVMSNVISMFAGILTTVAMFATSLAFGQALNMFFGIFLTGLVLPLSAAFTALMYIDQRMRTEGLAPELAKASLQ